MKCCGCDKEVVLKPEIVNGEPQWFGRYQNQYLFKIICKDCVKDQKKFQEYSFTGSLGERLIPAVR